MIPIEVADIAKLIWIGWEDMDENEDRNEILAAAWRVYASGYRKVAAQEAIHEQSVPNHSLEEGDQPVLDGDDKH